MEENLSEDLQALGLSDSEARVYLSCLRLGGASASEIAKSSEVERTNCYHVLKNLAQRGLISTSNKGSLQYYLAESPKRLLAEMNQRVSVAERLLPSLLAMENSTAAGLKPQTKVYEGKSAVERLLYQSLESSGEILSYTNIYQLISKFGDALGDYCAQRAERSIKSRIISPYHPQAESLVYKHYPESYLQTKVELLYVNAKEFFLENEVSIYDNCVSIISLSPDEDIGVSIESKVYAETSRTIFNLSWLGATTFVAR